ncbi:hypothetical protein KC717_00270 [Candidatus Dojkabacteria bacterium]|uniref:Uncharacterized protein n=1 Tax=Candidatus Dojkabacteria bacterium TaxID=2099670 RepID=A0A955RJT0_9BACT|nr:hypothetical protein [Candidatus Dojkabacteria bacterium]
MDDITPENSGEKLDDLTVSKDEELSLTPDIEDDTVKPPVKEPKKKPKTKLLVMILLPLLFLCVSTFVFLLVSAFLRVRNAETAEYKRVMPEVQDVVSIELPLSDVQIIESDTSEMNISLQGPEYFIASLRLTEFFSTTKLGTRYFSPASSPFIRMFSRDEQLSGTISIPTGVALELIVDNESIIRVDGVSTTYQVEADGDSQVIITNSSVENGIFSLNSNAHVEIADCQGNLSLVVKDKGDFVAEKCLLEEITIDVDGTGSIEIQDGTITNGFISMSGKGSIVIPRPSERTRQDVDGTGEVQFLN